MAILTDLPGAVALMILARLMPTFTNP